MAPNPHIATWRNTRYAFGGSPSAAALVLRAFSLMPDHFQERRRSLEFDDLSQVMPEVHRVRSYHATAGRWSPGRVCAHLAHSFNGSMDGLDLSRHRFKRWFFAKSMLRYTFRHGIPAGYTVDPNIEPASDVAPDEAVEALSRAIERYLRHRGPLQAHPLFGRMSRKNWDRIHCIHCAHHLSFVVPEAE